MDASPRGWGCKPRFLNSSFNASSDCMTCVDPSSKVILGNWSWNHRALRAGGVAGVTGAAAWGVSDTTGAGDGGACCVTGAVTSGVATGDTAGSAGVGEGDCTDPAAVPGVGSVTETPSCSSCLRTSRTCAARARYNGVSGARRDTSPNVSSNVGRVLCVMHSR